MSDNEDDEDGRDAQILEQNGGIIREMTSSARESVPIDSTRGFCSGPSWPNAAYLLRAGGMSIDKAQL